MTNHIVCFDTETTGLDVQRDSIIQLSLVKFDSRTFEEIEALDWYILPSCPYRIDPAAEAVHHITQAKLEQEGVSLKSVYPQLMAFVEGCDILSYNGNSFDARILYYNLQREGLTFDFDNHIFYDAYIIEAARTSRKLSDVYRRYYGHDFEDAHNSLADVRATIAVFKAQNETRISEEEIHRPEFDFVSVDGFLALKDGNFVFAQGKYRGKTIAEIALADTSYLDWVCKNCAEPTRQYITTQRAAKPQPAQQTQETQPTAKPTPKSTTKSTPKPDTPSIPTQMSLF